MIDVECNKRASAFFNGDFFAIFTQSGYRRTVADDEKYSAYLPPNASDENLGESVLLALSHSRIIRPDDMDFFNKFFDRNRIISIYEQWVSFVLEKYNYKSRKKLFENMMSCNIISLPLNIEISPTIHEQLEGWGGFPLKDEKKMNVVIPADSTPEIVGRALRTAFERCE